MAILTNIAISALLVASGTAAQTIIETPVEGTHWVIEAVTDSAGTAAIPATPEAYVEISGGELEGFTGCNWVSGFAEVGESESESGESESGESGQDGGGQDEVTLTNMGYTKRGCSNYPEWLEMRMQWVLDDGVLSAVVVDDTLTLTRPEGSSLFLRAR